MCFFFFCFCFPPFSLCLFPLLPFDDRWVALASGRGVTACWQLQRRRRRRRRRHKADPYRRPRRQLSRPKHRRRRLRMPVRSSPRIPRHQAQGGPPARNRSRRLSHPVGRHGLEHGAEKPSSRDSPRRQSPAQPPGSVLSCQGARRPGHRDRVHRRALRELIGHGVCLSG